MTERIVHFQWINRAHNPHPREFIGGYHTGAVCKHTDKSGRVLAPLKPRKLLIHYKGNNDPNHYKNSLYDNPALHKSGYHERKYLLKGREYFVPEYYMKPYYIDQLTLNDTITRSDLTRRNLLNATVLSTMMDDTGKYSYRNEPLYNNKVISDEVKFGEVLKKNEYAANKATLEKQGEMRAVDRDAAIREKNRNARDGPVLKQDYIAPVPAPQMETVTTYETVTVPVYQQQTEVLVPQERIITQQIIEPTQIIEPIQTTSTTTTSSSMMEQPMAAPIFKEEKYASPSSQTLSYSEITKVPIQMTSSEFGGGQNSATPTGKKGRKAKKQQQKQFREETIAKTSTDGGKSWTNDSKLAGENVEIIEEHTIIN